MLKLASALLILVAAAPATAKCPSAKEEDVRAEFARWVKAYEARDLAGTMAIFAPDVRFQFQGAKDQGWKELEADYSASFKRPGAVTWVPKWEEVLVSGDLAAAFATWSAVATTSAGAREVRRENRSVDIFKRDTACRWRIVRSLTYPLLKPTPPPTTAGAIKAD